MIYSINKNIILDRDLNRANQLGTINPIANAVYNK